MRSTSKSEQPIISNAFVTCYSDRFVINLYYFPYGRKTIKYKDIRSCGLFRLKNLQTSKYKTWGMGLSLIWWHSDISRYYRKYYVLLNTNHWPRIGITMDDDDLANFYRLLEKNIKINPSQKEPFNDDEKVDVNVINSVTTKQLQYGNSLESDGEDYVDW